MPGEVGGNHKNGPVIDFQNLPPDFQYAIQRNLTGGHHPGDAGLTLNGGMKDERGCPDGSHHAVGLGAAELVKLLGYAIQKVLMDGLNQQHSHFTHQLLKRIGALSQLLTGTA